jgi:hypothetical protein
VVVVVSTPLPMNRFNAWFLRFFFWVLWPQQEGGHDEILCTACQLCTGAASAEFIELLLSEIFLINFTLKILDWTSNMISIPCSQTEIKQRKKN